MSTLSVMCLYELSEWKVTPVFSTTENLHPWEKSPLMIEESWCFIGQKHTLFMQLFKLKPNLIFLSVDKKSVILSQHFCVKVFPLITSLEVIPLHILNDTKPKMCYDTSFEDSAADLKLCWLVVFSGIIWWGMVAGTGVPMKVDTGLFTAQPIERDPADGVQGTVYHMTPAGKTTRLTFTTQQCTMGFFSMRILTIYFLQRMSRK